MCREVRTKNIPNGYLFDLLHGLGDFCSLVGVILYTDKQKENVDGNTAGAKVRRAIHLKHKQENNDLEKRRSKRREGRRRKVRWSYGGELLII